MTFSQRSQDIFASDILGGKRNGYFLDFGCRGPIDINNTYLFEKDYNFTGLSFDIDSNAINEWKYSDRKYENAICMNLVDTENVMSKIDSFYKTNIIDYLSFDLEPPLITLEVLQKFPFDKYKFGVITYEHDFYRGFDTLNPSREIFVKNGYKKITKEHMIKYEPISKIHLSEDWWIHPDVVDVSEDILDNELKELDLY